MQDITRPCAHEALTRPRKLAIELWKQSWLLSLNRIRLQDGACAALIPSLYRSSTRCCRSGGMRSSRLSVWIHFSDNGPQFGYLETNDWIRGWSSVTHVGLRNDCLERKQSLASSDFAVKFSTNSWASDHMPGSHLKSVLYTVRISNIDSVQDRTLAFLETDNYDGLLHFKGWGGG